MCIKELQNTFRFNSSTVVYEYRLPDMAYFGYPNASVYIEYNSETQVMKEFVKFDKNRELIIIGVSSVKEENLSSVVDAVLDIDFTSLLTCFRPSSEYDMYKPSWFVVVLLAYSKYSWKWLFGLGKKEGRMKSYFKKELRNTQFFFDYLLLIVRIFLVL